MDIGKLIDLFNARRYAEAEAAAAALLERDKDNGLAWKIYGEVKARQGKPAVAEFSQALRLLPRDPEVCCSYGTALREAGNPEAAIACYRLAIGFKPDYAAAHCNLGVAHENLKHYAAAEKAYLDALRLAPGEAQIHNNLGLLYYSQKRLDEARTHYEAAIRLQGDLAEAHVGLANTRLSVGDTEAANQGYQAALSKRGKYPEAELNLAMSLLAEGKFEQGWQHYEARLETTPKKPQLTVPRELPYPKWQGQDLAGKSILIHHEQGFGDNIQFIRYAALLKQRGAAHVELFCTKALQPVLETVSGVDSFISNRLEARPHDYWCPIGSLPLHCNTDASSIPCGVPYLRVPEAYQSTWRAATASNRFKVGLVWRGNPGHVNDANRSLPGLHTLGSLWQVPGAEFFSLQKWAGEKEATVPPVGQPIVDLGSKIEDFGDTAAIVEQLDLIVCVDTAVAHVAGALGKPCWVMLPAFCTDWRWLLQRADSPWYPSLRLFRQTKIDDWNEVVADIAAALRGLVG